MGGWLISSVKTSIAVCKQGPPPEEEDRLQGAAGSGGLGLAMNAAVTEADMLPDCQGGQVWSSVF